MNRVPFVILVQLLPLILADSLILNSSLQDDMYLKYFDGLEPSYFVNIDLTNSSSKVQFNSGGIFRNWYGLFIQPRQSQVKHQSSHLSLSYHFTVQNDSAAIADQDKNSTNNKQFEANQTLSINLLELCNNYFIKQPKFLRIINFQMQLQDIKSLFWTSDFCSPQSIFLLYNPQIDKYLQQQGYRIQHILNKFAFYIRINLEREFAATKIQNSLKKVKMQEWNRLYSQLIATIGEATAKTKQEIEKSLIIYAANEKVISIADIIEDFQVNNSVKYIIFRNVLTEENLMILSTEKYTITDKQVNNVTLKNITITFDNTNLSIFVFGKVRSSFRIYEQLQKKKCTNISVIQTVNVIIRGVSPVTDQQHKEQKQNLQTQKPQKQQKQPKNEQNAQQSTPPSQKESNPSKQAKNIVYEMLTTKLALIIFLACLLIVVGVVLLIFRKMKQAVESQIRQNSGKEVAETEHESSNQLQKISFDK